MITYDPSRPYLNVVFKLNERNDVASKIIDRYIGLHRRNDPLLCVIGIIPGAIIPALMLSSAIQSIAIYRPMARELAVLYQAASNEVGDIQHEVARQAPTLHGVRDIADDFNMSFTREMTGEVFLELTFAVLTTLIPFVGVFAGIWLTKEIATKMTNRIGRMVAIYFQNSGRWAGGKQQTYETSKELPRDLNLIRCHVPMVHESLIRSVIEYVQMTNQDIASEQTREALQTEGIPEDLIEETFRYVQ